MTTVELPVPAVAEVPLSAPPARRPARSTPTGPIPTNSTPPATGPAQAGPAPTGAGPTRLRLPGRTLLLVAGMPGSGKSTLLAGLPASPGLVVLDSDAHRAALGRRFAGLPYRRYRPLVHLLHRLALVRAARSDAATVAVHLPATGIPTRAAVVLLALLTGRTAHLLWLHANPDEALSGQHDRGRLVPSGSFAAHARRAVATHRRLLRSHGRVRGFSGVTLLDRPAARAGLVLDTGAER